MVSSIFWQFFVIMFPSLQKAIYLGYGCSYDKIRHNPFCRAIKHIFEGNEWFLILINRNLKFSYHGFCKIYRHPV